MTYIEFFDKTASRNVCACLTYVPDRVIYLGDNGTLMKKHIESYQKVFSERGYSIEFLYKSISKHNLGNAVEVLTELVESYPDCAFGITGGEEILLLALGIVYSRFPEKNIQIHKFNIQNNMVHDCDKDGVTIYRDVPALSVDENIRIYGGEVVYGTVDENSTYKWDLTPEFIKDLELIWDVCKSNVRLWNAQIGMIEAVKNAGTLSEDGLTLTAPQGRLQQYLARHNLKYRRVEGIIQYLQQHGLITRFDDESAENISITFKDKQVRRCLSTAGQALEMKVFVTAKKVCSKDGAPVYSDALNGVLIDWDGEFHDEESEKIYDTENEIDVLLMHDIVPVFVSCKNGVVTMEELYKLNTVAERFGGPYAKKVLVATSLDRLGESGEYIRQRAQDMKIRVEENIQYLDDAELERKLKSFWSN